VAKISQIYRIEDGILAGTEISPFMSFLLVKYPHRKTQDCYIPPMIVKDKEVKTWHCCQCDADFEGEFDTLIEHLMLHKGRLLKPWSKKIQLKSPIPAVKIPPNDWENNRGGINDDRWFCIKLYIDNLKHWLRQQGLEVIETSK